MKNSNTPDSVQRLALDGILTAVLVLLGMIKLPSLIPGAEFQLSAPYAVCLAAVVGFRRYLGSVSAPALFSWYSVLTLFGMW